jgi:hypothetical protein
MPIRADFAPPAIQAAVKAQLEQGYGAWLSS